MTTLSQEPAFIMHGARSAIAGGMLHIEEQVKALERAVAENTGLVFDLARTLIESTCRTILTERGSTFSDDDNLSKLFKMVTQIMPFLPPTLSAESGARRSLEQTLSGLSTALQGVCELRNEFGFASHGIDRPRPPMEDVQALLAAQAADAIVGFLYRIHRQDLSRSKLTPLNYDNQPEFNDWIDNQNDLVRVFTLEYKPSEVLFNMDLQAYRDLLPDYESAAVDEEGGETE